MRERRYLHVRYFKEFLHRTKRRWGLGTEVRAKTVIRVKTSVLLKPSREHGVWIHLDSKPHTVLTSLYIVQKGAKDRGRQLSWVLSRAGTRIR